MLPDWMRRFTQRRKLEGLSEPLQRELERKNREDEYQLRNYRKARWGRWVVLAGLTALAVLFVIGGTSTDKQPTFPKIEGCPKTATVNESANCLGRSFTPTTVTVVVQPTIPTTTVPVAPAAPAS